jgi:hypothetical protein
MLARVGLPYAIDSPHPRTRFSLVDPDDRLEVLVHRVAVGEHAAQPVPQCRVIHGPPDRVKAGRTRSEERAVAA